MPKCLVNYIVVWPEEFVSKTQLLKLLSNEHIDFKVVDNFEELLKCAKEYGYVFTIHIEYFENKRYFLVKRRFGINDKGQERLYNSEILNTDSFDEILEAITNNKE